MLSPADCNRRQRSLPIDGFNVFGPKRVGTGGDGLRLVATAPGGDGSGISDNEAVALVVSMQRRADSEPAGISRRRSTVSLRSTAPGSRDLMVFAEVADDVDEADARTALTATLTPHPDAVAYWLSDFLESYPTD